MSSYNQPYRRQQQQYWSSRDAQREAERKAAEEAHRKKNVMNDTNFPTLSTVPTNQRDALPGKQFAKLAEQWAINDAVDRRMAEYKKLQESAERHNAERIASRHVQHSREARHDEYYEEQLASEPVARSILDDDAGWTEVKTKTRKGRRELTDEEMLALDHQQNDGDTHEFNSHLFESNRHDHDRV